MEKGKNATERGESRCKILEERAPVFVDLQGPGMARGQCVRAQRAADEAEVS